MRIPIRPVASALFVTFLTAACTQTSSSRVGPAYEELALRAADGVELLTWFLPARGTPYATAAMESRRVRPRVREKLAGFFLTWPFQWRLGDYIRQAVEQAEN